MFPQIVHQAFLVRLADSSPTVFHLQAHLVSVKEVQVNDLKEILGQLLSIVI
jgi:hypothetical protein